MKPYIFFLILTVLFFVITLIRIYRDRRKITGPRRDSAFEYFFPLHEATGPGAIFSVLLVVMVWWTIIKILSKAIDIILQWIN